MKNIILLFTILISNLSLAQTTRVLILEHDTQRQRPKELTPQRSFEQITSPENIKHIRTRFKLERYIEHLIKNRKKLFKAGDKFILSINTHGQPKTEKEISHTIELQDGNISLDRFNYLLKYLADDGVKVALLDTSCYSQASFNYLQYQFLKDKVCIVGADSTNYTGDAIFPTSLLQNLEKGLSIEEIFLKSRTSVNASSPNISTDRGLKVNELIHELNAVSTKTSLQDILTKYLKVCPKCKSGFKLQNFGQEMVNKVRNKIKKEGLLTKAVENELNYTHRVLDVYRERIEKLISDKPVILKLFEPMSEFEEIFLPVDYLKETENHKLLEEALMYTSNQYMFNELVKVSNSNDICGAKGLYENTELSQKERLFIKAKIKELKAKQRLNDLSVEDGFNEAKILLDESNYWGLGLKIGMSNSVSRIYKDLYNALNIDNENICKTFTL